jgi:hypothetical protein
MSLTLLLLLLLLLSFAGHHGDWPNWIHCDWPCYVNWYKNYVQVGNAFAPEARRVHACVAMASLSPPCEHSAVNGAGKVLLTLVEKWRPVEDKCWLIILHILGTFVSDMIANTRS